MSANSRIEWCDHTFNAWIGCTEVSPACDHCYARDMASRYGWAKWGVDQPRHRTSPSNWKQPLAWNRKAEREGRRARVFSLSLGDWADPEVPPPWRSDLFDLVEATPHLDWLLLTKRHALARRFLAERWSEPQPNVQIGMTVEDEKMARIRLPRLARLGLAGWRTFISYEPALGPVDWAEWLRRDGITGGCFHHLIAGGESGPEARPPHPDWFRIARDACQRNGVPFLLKQWGEWRPPSPTETYDTSCGRAGRPAAFLVGHGGTVHCFRESAEPGAAAMIRVGKKAAGRELDGVVWDQFPEVAHA